MNAPNRLPQLSLRKRPIPGLEVIEALLDQLPVAALLVETSSRRIILSNAGVTELTGLTRLDLTQLNLESILPALDRGMFIENQDESTRYWDYLLTSHHTHRLPPVEVQVTPFLLDKAGKWALVCLEPIRQRERRQAEEIRRTRVWQALRILALSPQLPDLSRTLASALEAGNSLTGVPILGIYQNQGDQPLLKRTAVFGPGEMLPDETLLSELTSLHQAQIWTRGRRASSNLQRAARAARLQYMASAPLGEKNAWIGLLILAGDQPEPPDNLLIYTELLATALTSILQNYTLIHNLASEVDDQKQEARVHSYAWDALHEGIITLGSDLTIQSLNPSAEAILGYATREVRSLPYHHILIGADNLIPPFFDDQGDLNVHNIGNIRLYRRDGHDFLAHVQAIPIVHQDHLESMVVVIQDLSQEEQFRIQNQQLEQRAILGEVSAIFAHEVRNPINNLSTGLQVLAMSLPAEDPKQEMLNRLQADCNRLEELVKSTLSFVRPMEYKMEAVDLGKSLRRLLDRWHHHLARVNIQGTVQVEANTPAVEGDPRALEQVWNNLIQNAIQAMSASGGTLAVKIRSVIVADNTYRVEISFSDTGTGIPEEIRDRIFEPFFTTNRNGTGLGLPITKHIITAHKGAISVTSVPGGTVFKVQLPIASRRLVTESEANVQ